MSSPLFVAHILSATFSRLRPFGGRWRKSWFPSLIGTFLLWSMPCPSSGAGAEQVIISEFMASNKDSLRDGYGNPSDWIEVHNAGSTPVNLGGWHLTDDAQNLTQWTFPSYTLGPGGFLVVFA